MTAERIAVTGSSGFVGRHVIPGLRAAGYEPIALVRDASAAEDRADVIRRTVQFGDPRSVDRAFAGVAGVVHLAGRAHVRRERGSAADAYRAANVDVSVAVAEAAVRAGVRTVAYASSLKVYGDADVIGPSTDAVPNDAYGRSKLEAEQAIQNALAGSGTHFTALRFPLLYGPGVKGNIRRLFDAVYAGRPLPVRGLNAPRSMLGVANLVHGIVAVLQPGWQGGICLATDGDDVSPERLVRLIGDVLGRPARLIRMPTGLLRLAGRIGDEIARAMPWPLTSSDVARLTRASEVDSRATWAALGTRPVSTVREELERTASWYRSTRQR